MRNAFETSDELGRQYLKTFLDQIQATDQSGTAYKDRLDYLATIKGKKTIWEIKVRGSFYKDMMIEENKLEALKNRKINDQLDQAYYVNFWNSNEGLQMFFWDLPTIYKYATAPFNRNCPKTTINTTGNIDKLCRDIPVSKSFRAIYINNKWMKYADYLETKKEAELLEAQ